MKKECEYNLNLAPLIFIVWIKIEIFTSVSAKPNYEQQRHHSLVNSLAKPSSFVFFRKICRMKIICSIYCVFLAANELLVTDVVFIYQLSNVTATVNVNATLCMTVSITMGYSINACSHGTDRFRTEFFPIN